jgi:hypothetical protein
MSLITSVPPQTSTKVDRTINRAIDQFNEARSKGFKTFEALIPARQILSKAKLSRKNVDKCFDILHDYADNFFDQDYPKGTFGYSDGLPNN